MPLRAARVIVPLLTAAVAACSGVARAQPAATTRPNVVVMIADDLGSGDVSCLFRDVVKTPSIDRLAAMGVKFTSGYVTAPLCGPSRAGFFTGRYQQRFGFIDNGGGIPTDLPVLPGVLRDAGYRTALIGKWHSAGPMPSERRCFDESLCSVKSSPFINYHHPVLSRNGKTEKFDEYSTDLFAREAEAFIDRNKDRPFDLTVTFNAPHILNVVEDHGVIEKKYNAAVAAGETYDIRKNPTARPGEAAKYAAQFPGDTARADTVATIVALDQAVGRILDKLKEDGLEKKTIVFLFADNGGHPENRSENLPLRDYKWTTYEGGIRIPFIAAYPGVFPAGLTFAQPVSTLDIFPTCTALAHVPPPAGLDGVDLTPYLNGVKTSPPHEALFFSQDGMGAVRAGNWKLVMLKGKGRAAQLYDVSKDVEEKDDLAAAEPARVQELTAKWQTWNAQVSPDGKAAKPPLPEVPAALAVLKPQLSFDRGLLRIGVDSDKPLTGEQWDAVASLHPKEFGFKDHALDDSGMDRLVALDPVAVGLNVSPLTGRGFAKFGQMPSLVALHTNHTITPTPEARGSFTHHPALESFSTVGPFGVEALDAPKLKTVVLEHGAASDAIVARLANHPAVETLKLGEWGGSTLTDAAMPTLATLKKLTRLQIYLTALSYGGLRQLKDLPDLATLDLIEVELPEGDLEKLKAELPGVKITWKAVTPEGRVKRQKALEKLGEKQHPYLRRNPVLVKDACEAIRRAYDVERHVAATSAK